MDTFCSRYVSTVNLVPPQSKIFYIKLLTKYRHTWMRDFTSNLPHERSWDGESRRNPAIGIDDMDRNIVVIDALDWISDILFQKS